MQPFLALAARPRLTLQRGTAQALQRRGGVPRAAPRLRLRLVGAAAGTGSGAAGDAGSDRCGSLDECIEQARHRARKLEDGAVFVPLTTAKGFFEAGLHACAEVPEAQERVAEAEECAAELQQEKTWLEEELLALADVAQQEREKHELEMRSLLQFARNLEAEVDEAKRSLKHKVEEAEERVAHRYQAEAEAAAAAAAVAAGGDREQLERALKATTASQRAWRARALQVEGQFAKLRGMIEARMVHAAEEALDMRRARERDEAAATAELQRKHLGGAGQGEFGDEEALEWEAAGLDQPS